MRGAANSLRLAALVATLAFGLAAGLAVAGCGRDRPGEVDAGAGAAGDTSSFGEIGGLEGLVRGDGAGPGLEFAQAAAQGFREDEPGVVFAIEPTEPAAALDRLCSGKADFAAATVEKGSTTDPRCEQGAVEIVGFHVANDRSSPIVLYVSRDAITRFEVEAFVQYVVDNDEELAEKAGVGALGIDELQETTTKLEQVIAGVG